MFEQKLEDMLVTVFIDQKSKDILDMYGFQFDFSAGWNALDYEKAVKLLKRYRETRPTVAKGYKTNLKQLDAAFRGIMSAFGPEFLNQYQI